MIAGYLTPYKCLRHTASSLKWLRKWGCRAYVQKPRAEIKKDVDAQAYAWILIGYSEEKIG